MENEEDLYKILGIASDASQEEVRTACRRILTQVHPDHGGSDVLFRVVYRAYRVLTDPVRRAEYDERLRMGDAPGEPEQGPAEDDGDDLGEWVPPEDAPPTEVLRTRTSPRERARPRGSVAQHPSLSVLTGAFVLLVVASVAHLHGLVSFSMAIGGVALMGQAGHGRALRAEQARRARIGDVDVMSDQEFERHLVAVFRRDGFAVRQVARSGGADLVLKKDGVTTVVEARHWPRPVAPEVIHEVVAARARYRADEALVVTNAVLSPDAVDLAGSEEVALMGRPELTALMAGQAAAPPARGVDLLRRELQHGIPAALGLVSALLLGIRALLDALGAAWEAGVAPADEITPSPCEATPPKKGAAAS